MVNRFILNELSYFGAGSRKELPGVVNRLGYKKALVVTDKDGNKQDMKTFKKLVLNGVTDMGGEYGDVDHDRMYALIESGKDFVLIQNYVFDKVLHDVRYFEAGHPIRFEMGTIEVFE